MKKRHISILLAMVMILTIIGTACGTGAGTDTSAPTADSGSTDSGTDAGDAAPAELSPMTLEVYSQPANFQGEQVGWMAKILKDELNITLSIIAPQVAGADIFAARAASGFLGDIVVLDNVDIQSCISSGLIFDITEEMKSFKSFNDYKPQLDYYNSSLEGVGEGVYYAWPCEMANTSPTTYSPTVPGVAPTIQWDYYSEIGAPDLKNLSDLIDALKKIQDIHPTNEAGDASYGITLWPDWDGTSMENVNQLTKWYGQEVKESIMIDTDNNMIPLTDDNGAYRKILQFYFDANQAGIIDPDSGTQNWDAVWPKFGSKRAFLIWNDWQGGFWNTTERGNSRENFMMVPVEDMKIYQPSDPYYGTARAFACGTDDPERKARAAMLLDWMSSPEGAQTIHTGIYGYNYVDAPDGNGYVRTPYGETALMDNAPVAEEYGGGLYSDGNLQINQWMVAGNSAFNPLTGDSYGADYWPAEVEKAKTTTKNEWSERFNATDPMDYLVKNNKAGIVPLVNVNLIPDTSDISIIRTSCKPLVVDASWKMVFASSQAEFDSIWEKLKTDLDGFGWNELVTFDKQKYQALVDERAKALAS